MTTTRVLLTGFGPFGNRNVNGSSIAVSRFADRSFVVGDKTVEIRAATCDVIWGAPSTTILPIVKEFSPHIVISFGEARDNFRLETVARRRRSNRRDVLGQLCENELICNDGDDELTPCFDAEQVRQRIDADGHDVPLVISLDAGQYLCDEMFYTLERARRDGVCDSLALVAFVHIPIFNTPVQRVSNPADTVPCDETLLERIVDSVVRAFVAELH